MAHVSLVEHRSLKHRECGPAEMAAPKGNLDAVKLPIVVARVHLQDVKHAIALTVSTYAFDGFHDV